jgi:hypothetical protein
MTMIALVTQINSQIEICFKIPMKIWWNSIDWILIRLVIFL